MLLQLGIIVAVTGGTIALVLTISALWQPGTHRVRRRLAGEFGGDTEVAANPLYRDLESLDITEAEPTAATAGSKSITSLWKDWEPRAGDCLRQAGLPGTAQHWAAACILTGLAFGLVGKFLDSWVLATVLAIGGLLAPVAIVAMRRKARREKYLKQLVGAFELMARVLRSGQSVPETFRAAVDAFDEPLASEFGRCLHQIEHGLRPEEAYRELANRSGVLELRIFVVAMSIQRQTGGNLSEVLDRLATTVRTRIRLRQKMRALTAEGRLQSWTLTGLPFFTFGVMYFLNRQYAAELLTHTKLLYAMAGCMLVGVLWIRNILKFEG